MSRPLNTYIAVRESAKARIAERCNQLHKQLQSPEPLTGHDRSYQPYKDDDIVYPSENKMVQFTAQHMLGEMAELTRELFDTVATVDYGNRVASADVMVDGKAILVAAPVPFLIWIEKQLVDLRTSVNKACTLATDRAWPKFSTTTGIHEAEPQLTNKTKKIVRPLVKAPATEHHPAQVELVQEDVNEGRWTTVHMSGALSIEQRKRYLDRLQTLIDAVKVARETANAVAVDPARIGKAILDYVMS